MTFYELVKYTHVTAITLSISGFILRVVLKLNNSPYQTKYWFKKLPHKVDIVLLASALTMVYILGVNPLTTYWIAEKIIGLLIYIMLGMVALRWGKTRNTQIIAAGLAVLVFSYIVYVAHYKTPAVVFSYS
ncbi:MAG: SirB2 family protein [gamma proteobacterium symbiont of Bathyaustriella thionipta]|nr:SirB2 family protein [gamma proteobacterium symbiont of Bathyaustriella thionipta]MCU7950264.1 SirB2 family protein [gamma proteobacterium symbiont of Bathyaustriella thionipta]MCU7953402.1 SirB2 family protein [gamma proteobacterium symbiont of Bathyaustriella thionipta]MCU7956781.1 SirB2 family protein [gamma proteobacterium symbiont of Bathyaustriella thionipta]MCU7967507.1 SirB2 family protein [gamma proteobacterium symbiont of Bathyaustriella thionipta]